MPVSDPSARESPRRTWWAWSDTAVRPVLDPDSAPPGTVVLEGPASATEAEANRAFLRWFRLLRSGDSTGSSGDEGIGDDWNVRPLRDGASRPHDPFAWDSRDVALATLTSCRTIEDLESIGSLLPIARILVGDRATRPFARVLAEAVFESLARGHTSFSAIRLATAAAPLFSSEQLTQMVLWNDEGHLLVPAGRVRVLADDLGVLFGGVKSPNRRIALVEGAWSHAVQIASFHAEVRRSVDSLAQRRRLTVPLATRYVDQIAVGDTDELRDLVRRLLGRDLDGLLGNTERDPGEATWRLPEFLTQRSTETVRASFPFPSRWAFAEITISRRLVEDECLRTMADVAADLSTRYTWLSSVDLRELDGVTARSRLDRAQLELWTTGLLGYGDTERSVLSPDWLVGNRPTGLDELIGLLANHHRLTSTTRNGRARTWLAYAREISNFDLGEFAVPESAWIDDLDGAVLEGGLTVSVARTPQTLLEWSNYMRNCIYAGWLEYATEGRLVFLGVNQPDGTLLYNASVWPTTGDLHDIVGRFNQPAPPELKTDLVELLRRLVGNDATLTDDTDTEPQRASRGPRGSIRRSRTRARQDLTDIETQLQRDDEDREKSMTLVRELGEQLGLLGTDWRLTVRRLDHVDDEQLRGALEALGNQRRRRTQRKLLLDWDPLDGLVAPESLTDALMLVRTGVDEAEFTRPIRVLRSLELRSRWLLARLQRRISALSDLPQ